jgi:hypothetical protein
VIRKAESLRHFQLAKNVTFLENMPSMRLFWSKEIFLRGNRLLLCLMFVGASAHADPVSLEQILVDGGDQHYVASQRSAVRDGFSIPSSPQRQIILFRPDVRISEQTTAGLDQPKADWTEAAREHLFTAIKADQARRGLKLQIMPDLVGDDARLMAGYKKLFKTVADSAIRHSMFAQTPLPTKAAQFDWSLGPGIAKLASASGGDYGLFVYASDSYVSQGRKNARLISRMMGSTDTDTGGESRIGFAGLVDLKTGNLLWLNVDVQGRGDLRSALGADVRVAGLLRGFPASIAPATSGKVR